MSWAQGLSKASSSGAIDFEAFMPPAAVLAIWPSAAIGMVLAFVFFAAYEAACLRWLARGEAGGFFLGLDLGADTWRVWFTYWIWLFLFIGECIVAALVVGLIGAGLEAAGVAGFVKGLVIVLAVIAVVCAMIWISVRLAPAAATSVALQRFAFFKAWSASRGRFWPLFGAFAFLWILYLIASFIIGAVSSIALLGPMFARLSESGGAASPEAVMTMFTDPVMIGMQVAVNAVYFVIGLVFYIVVYGVNARTAMIARAEGRIA
jgi:hypothetical protein